MSHTPEQALDLAYQTLRQARPDAFEIYFEKRSATKADSKELKIESVTQAEDVGIAIRVLLNQKAGFSFTTSLDPSAIKNTVQTALAIAEVMPADDFLTFGAFDRPVTASASQLNLLDRTGLSAPIDKKLALAVELERLTLAEDKRIQTVRSASFSQNHFHTLMIDTEGRRLEEEASLFSVNVTCKADQDGDQQMGGDFGFARHLSELQIAPVAKEAARTAVEILNAKSAPTLQCPAIFRNSVVAELLEFLSNSFSSEQIDKGMSLLAGKRGQKLFSPLLQIEDEPLLPKGYGSGLFDAEGVPCQNWVLIRNGVFETQLTNRLYAKKLGLPLTGSSSRSIKSPPSIAFGNLKIRPGKSSPAQLIAGVSKGILITDLMGLHTANPITGDFSLGASGILIEGGALTTPVKGFAVAGNIMELFNQIEDIGDDLRYFGNVGTPSLRVARLSVGGK